jgi:hypothetical protein
MIGENLYARTRARIITLYEDKDHLTQQRAWYLYLLCVFLIICECISIPLWVFIISNSTALMASVTEELSSMSRNIEAFIRKLDRLVTA